MATEVEPPALPPAVNGEHSFSKEELERMLEFDKIVKFRDSITSGQHPRIKIPPHLLPAASTSTTRSSSDAAGPMTASEQHPDSGSSKNKRKAESGRAQAAGMVVLPGLGLVPSAPAAMAGQTHGEAGEEAEAAATSGKEQEEVRADPALLARPGSLSSAEVAGERAKLEKALKAQVTQRAQANKTHQVREALPDFVVDEVLQKARMLEERFTPPLQPAAAANDATNTPPASGIAGASVVAAADDSVDEATFYSSNFSTPEFALKSRVSIEPEADDVSMEEGSDYEPELDIVPSPIVPQEAPREAHREAHEARQEAPADDAYDPAQPYMPLAPTQPPTQYQGLGFYGAPLPLGQAMQSTPSGPSGPPPPQAGDSQWQGSWPGPAGELQPRTDSAQASSGESSLRMVADDANPRPPSPFVRVHGLSPVGPQPLTLAPQITPALQEQAEAQAAQAAQAARAAEAARSAEAAQRAPGQVALLRREEVSQSSPDSSPRTNSGRQDEKKKNRKKNNKRKASQPDASPRVKPEPKSPSPIVAPPSRPNKRPKQAQRTREEEQDARYGAGYGHVAREGYASGAHYAEQPRPVAREERVPVVYERVEPLRYVHPGTAPSHPIDLQQHEPYPRRDWEVYETRPPARELRNTVPTSPLQPAGPPSARYALPPSRADLRSVRAASHALVEASSGYPPPVSRSGYPAANSGTGAYESGRMSMRPESVRDRSRSPVAAPPRTPAMGPPSGPPSARPQYRYPEDMPPAQQPVTRIVVDEFGREYYEPPRPPMRQRVRYEAEDVRQEWSQPAPTYTPAQPPPPRAGSQMAPAFEQESVVYRRASPAYAQPRRVVTQPEYAGPPPAPDYGRYRQREYVARPPPADEEYVQIRQAPPPPHAPPPRDYMGRASTALPPDAVRYEVPPPLGRYVERVGSVRPPDAVPVGHEYAGQANIPAYGGRVREVPAAGGYVTGGRAYSVRPETQQPVVQRAYSVRPASPGLPPPGPPGPAPYYVERVPPGPGPEYGYPDDGRQNVYR